MNIEKGCRTGCFNGIEVRHEGKWYCSECLAARFELQLTEILGGAKQFAEAVFIAHDDTDTEEFSYFAAISGSMPWRMITLEMIEEKS